MTLPTDPDAQPTGPLGRPHTVWWAILFALVLAALGYGYFGRRAIGTTEVPADTATTGSPSLPTAPPTNP
jgi:hypothetical protein